MFAYSKIEHRAHHRPLQLQQEHLQHPGACGAAARQGRAAPSASARRQEEPEQLQHSESRVARRPGGRVRGGQWGPCRLARQQQQREFEGEQLRHNKQQVKGKTLFAD